MVRSAIVTTAIAVMLIPIRAAMAQQVEPPVSQKAALIRACEQLLRDVGRIRESFPRNRNILFASNQASRELSWFTSKAPGWTPKSPQEGRGLRESIEGMIACVRSLPRSARTFEALLPLIAEDLSVKRIHCSYEGLAARQPVRVLTKRQGVTEVKGLEVLYLEKFFEFDEKARPHQFRGFSSPAVDDLVPGRYVVWARDPANPAKRAPRRDARVGKTERDVKAAVPVGSAIDIEVLAP
jgi:hypothetical protein